ncbi:MAG: glycoside hydrolase family 92 protein [Alphaproteobacteria bacterium]|nr:glycoside hydrolase family 92 protein [Alphaproteobacteria bacterium]
MTFVLLSLLACSGGGSDSAGVADTGPIDPGPPVDLLPYVDPMIGTGGIGFSVGCAYPGANVPLGLVKVSPDTSDISGSSPAYHHGGGYHHDDVHVQGFSHMHMHGIGVTDYGVLAVMPVDLGSDGVLAPEQALEQGYKAPFTHDDEIARPGWYEVQLDEPDVHVTLTATARTALHRYAFGALETPALLLDLGHYLDGGRIQGGDITVDPATGRATGSLMVDGDMSRPFTVWFVIESDTAPLSVGTWQGGEGENGRDASNIVVQPGVAAVEMTPPDDWNESVDPARLGAWLAFPPGTEEVRLKVALSTVDADGAQGNFDAEAVSWEPDELEAAARAQWAERLSVLRVWGGSEDDRTKLATALYHSLQMPTLFSDVDGRYRGFDQEIHSADHGFHTDFSLWDTYRTLHPLYTLLWPETHKELLQSFTRMVEQGGNLPRWPAALWDPGTMIGMPANVVWAEAWRKGIRDWGEETVAARAVEVAMGEYTPAYGGRPDPMWLDTIGYYPMGVVGRSVSWTQEVAIADYALAEVVGQFGYRDQAIVLRDRSDAWARLYNPETGWMQGRNADLSWAELPSAEMWNDEMYAEGNARQYLWLAPHVPEQLVEVLGGDEVALARLVETMEGTADDEEDRLEAVPNAWYWHGNEPSLHIPWLFGIVGRPDLGRVWVRWVMDTYYGTGPDGITGNDDAGTSSAWFAFASMGIYPLAGTERYILGLPAFERVEWDLWAEGEDGSWAKGEPFTITSEVDPLAGADEVEVLLDGTPWVAPTFSHGHMRPGGQLHFRPAR